MGRYIMAISFREVVNQSLQDFWAKKIRTIVTVMGIILGTASIIIVMSIVQGSIKQTTQWIEETGGLKKIDIYINWEYNQVVNRKKEFEYLELKKLLRPIQGIESIDLNLTVWNSTIKYGKNDVAPWYRAVDSDFFKVEDWSVQEGRMFSEYDYKKSNQVALIGTNARKNLFGSINPLGKRIQVGDNFVTVVGILEYREFLGQSDLGQGNWLEWKNDMIVIPIDTSLKMNPNRNSIGNFTILTQDESLTESVQAKVEKTLNAQFNNKPVYRTSSNLERREEILKNSSKFNIIFYFISAISLIVGGIVIMNIMLATIKERTREIGVRMSIGGSKFDIFMQFLIQTVIITTLGGIIGVFVGIGLSSMVAQYVNVSIDVTSQLIIIALLMSSGVGLVFGIIPSWKACSLNPVTALRTE
ncbi:ABC transporter permease [bacterium]|nr:ABC transporter permease [bacterium]